MLLDLSTYFLYFIAYSFIGWVMETMILSVQAKKLVNRGYLNGPICPIYGFGAVTMILLLHDINNIFALFAASLLLASTLEYFTSFLMEKLFHARWWDYSHRPFNLNGRVCLENAVAFGILGVFMLKFIQPALSSLVSLLPSVTIYWVALILLILVLSDFAYTTFRFSKFSKKPIASKAGVYEKVNSQTRRIFKAFPKLEIKFNSDIVDEIRRQLTHKKPKKSSKKPK